MNAQAWGAISFFVGTVLVGAVLREFGVAALAEYRECEGRGWMVFGLICWGLMVAVLVYLVAWLTGAHVWPPI
jgi:glycerol uptake facilitator-like aquaporin